jgi:hypothetical protein
VQSRRPTEPNAAYRELLSAPLMRSRVISRTPCSRPASEQRSAISRGSASTHHTQLKTALWAPELLSAPELLGETVVDNHVNSFAQESSRPSSSARPWHGWGRGSQLDYSDSCGVLSSDRYISVLREHAKDMCHEPQDTHTARADGSRLLICSSTITELTLERDRELRSAMLPPTDGSDEIAELLRYRSELTTRRG